MAAISNDWLKVLDDEFKKPYYRELYNFVRSEYGKTTVYPPADDIFNAFHLTPLSKVKVLILGQDPYHEPGQAHGLAFSVKPGVSPLPPSLVNIYKEIEDEFGVKMSDSGYLENWAKQGVMMLNTCLTVRAHQAYSHAQKGWEQFTDACIRALNAENRPIVYMLWGKPAAAKEAFLNNPKQLVLKASHPSPLSAYRGFFGCGCFKMCNEFLLKNGLSEIDWKN